MQLSVGVEKRGAVLEGEGPEVVQAGLDRLVDMVVMFLTAEVQKRTPQGVYGFQGGLASTIKGEVVGRGTPVVRGTVFHTSKYGDVIEKGRAPGKWPPQGVMVRWIELKFGVDAATAKKVEFLVRRKIGQKGFKGYHMFELAATQNTGRIDAMAAAEGFKIAVELDG